jgi:hypothetical protein
MFTNNMRLRLAGCFAVAVLVPSTLGAQESPATLTKYHDDVIESRSTTVEGRMDEVDAVIRCSIERSETKVTQDPNLPRGLDPKQYGWDLVTQQTVRVLEIFKSDARLPVIGKSMTVVQSVGEAVVNGTRYEVKNGRSRPFAPTEEYVLFLRWDEAKQAFTVMASDAFMLTTGRITSLGSAPYAKREAAATPDELLAKLRALAH